MYEREVPLVAPVMWFGFFTGMFVSTLIFYSKNNFSLWVPFIFFLISFISLLFCGEFFSFYLKLRLGDTVVTPNPFKNKTPTEPTNKEGE